MSYKIVLSLLVSLNLIQVVLCQGLCAPSCESLPNGSLIPDPTNCTRYYACIDTGGGALPSEVFECNEGEYFDGTTDPPSCELLVMAPTGYCENPCSPCNIPCDLPGTLHPDPYSCSSYYVCLAEGDPLLVHCEFPNNFFNYLTLQCESSSESCYSFCDDCTVYCTEQDEMWPDPESCTNFYLCEPPYKTRLLCPDGERFDPDTRMCSSNVGCILCPWN